MWQVQIIEAGGACRHRIAADGSEIGFRNFFELLETDAGFVDWFSATLAAFDSQAFYWELPPLTASRLDDVLEFVLIDAPLLARLPADPGPFSDKFSHDDNDVIVFQNLGGDATLIVPCPRGRLEVFAHLASFLRGGDTPQVRELWRTTARALRSRLGDKPVWLSTAGLGVAWLHLRLDSRPKYYRHRPYTAAPAN